MDYQLFALKKQNSLSYQLPAFIYRMQPTSWRAEVATSALQTIRANIIAEHEAAFATLFIAAQSASVHTHANLAVSDNLNSIIQKNNTL